MRYRNLESWLGKSRKDVTPARNAGVYKMSMPVLLESLIGFIIPDLGGTELSFQFQNLEYCKWFPLTSEKPEIANDVKEIADMAVMKREGGGGKINLSKMDTTISLSLGSFCVHCKCCSTDGVF